MQNKNIQYLLGIDGGGTKTEFLLTDSDGNEIRRLFLDGSNPLNKGIDRACDVLKFGIMQICEDVDFSKVSVFAGVAGGKTGENKKRINEFLSQFGFASFDCGSDIDLALESALKGKDGIAVIMGTGIVAYARCNGNYYRTGGRGYMIDKGGSGFHFGSDALNSAFEFLDGRGGSEMMFGLVEKRLGKKLEDSVSDIYKGGAAYVASFTPVVFEAFKNGDSNASEIIDRNAYEAAKVINGAIGVFDKCDYEIVICGGLCKQKDILAPFLMKYIQSEKALAFLDEPMVNGAILLAKREVDLC